MIKNVKIINSIFVLNSSRTLRRLDLARFRSFRTLIVVMMISIFLNFLLLLRNKVTSSNVVIVLKFLKKQCPLILPSLGVLSSLVFQESVSLTLHLLMIFWVIRYCLIFFTPRKILLILNSALSFQYLFLLIAITNSVFIQNFYNLPESTVMLLITNQTLIRELIKTSNLPNTEYCDLSILSNWAKLCLFTSYVRVYMNEKVFVPLHIEIFYENEFKSAFTYTYSLVFLYQKIFFLLIALNGYYQLVKFIDFYILG